MKARLVSEIDSEKKNQRAWTKNEGVHILNVIIRQRINHQTISVHSFSFIHLFKRYLSKQVIQTPGKWQWMGRARSPFFGFSNIFRQNQKHTKINKFMVMVVKHSPEEINQWDV